MIIEGIQNEMNMGALGKYIKSARVRILCGDFDVDPVTCLILDDRRLIFVVLSKVGCTSIKATMGQEYGIGFSEASGLDIHRDKAWHREFGRLDDRYRDYFTFTFVRSPFSRLVSCYRDRVLYDAAQTDLKKYYFEDYTYPIPANISFAEFAQIVAGIPDVFADRHFKAQSHSLFRKRLNLKLDFIGRLETIEADWKEIAEQFGFDPQIHKLNPSSRNIVAPRRSYRDEYDAETLEIVRNRYRDDVENLGYEKEYLSIKREIETR